MKTEIEISTEDFIKLKKISSRLELTEKEYIELLVKNDLINNIYLDLGYIYDKRTKTLMIDSEVIVFNNMEGQLLDLLIINVGNYISNDEIIHKISNSKLLSVFGLRNLIKSIREKTNKRFIEMKSNIGYRINLAKLI